MFLILGFSRLVLGPKTHGLDVKLHILAVCFAVAALSLPAFSCGHSPYYLLYASSAPAR